MILRALLSGNVVLFEEALAELSGVPIDRVTSYIHDKNISGFRALYRKAGLPDAAYPAFREAIAAMREGVLIGEQGGAARLKRRMVERVLGGLRRRSADADSARCWRCCGASRSRPRARKRACSATIWSPNGSPAPHAELHRVDDAAGRLSFAVAARARATAPVICSSTSGRSRFSCNRNSSVTSRSRLVSMAASSLASEREYSR